MNILKRLSGSGRVKVRITFKNRAESQIYNMSRKVYDALIESCKIPDAFKRFSESDPIFLTDDILMIEKLEDNTLTIEAREDD